VRVLVGYNAKSPYKNLVCLLALKSVVAYTCLNIEINPFSPNVYAVAILICADVIFSNLKNNYWCSGMLFYFLLCIKYQELFHIVDDHQYKRMHS